MRRTRVAVLGAGPAGVGAAWQLTQRDLADVTVVEQRDDVGGNAASFELDGIPVDFGSHRLHPACKPFILEDIRKLLEDDLLTRPRHGRIRLRGRWIAFPLRAADLALHMPWSFGMGVVWDGIGKAFSQSRTGGDETFGAVLERGLGRTICRDFYFPYAAKMWGVPPEELSATQAYRRVSALSLAKMVGKVFGRKLGSGGARRHFYYPRMGYGQISRSMASVARDGGAEIHLGTRVGKIRLGSPHRIEMESDGNIHTIEAEHVWTTIPVNVLTKIVDPPPSL